MYDLYDTFMIQGGSNWYRENWLVVSSLSAVTHIVLALRSFVLVSVVVWSEGIPVLHCISIGIKFWEFSLYWEYLYLVGEYWQVGRCRTEDIPGWSVLDYTLTMGLQGFVSEILYESECPGCPDSVKKYNFLQEILGSKVSWEEECRQKYSEKKNMIKSVLREE